MTLPIAESDQALAALVGLSRRCREVETRAELGFVAVNETHVLSPFRQAALWLESGHGRSGKVVALSGIATVEGNAPYVQWLSQLFKRLSVGPEKPILGAAGSDALPAAIQSEWDDWLPACWVIVALPANSRFAGGALLLARDQPFTSSESTILTEWGATLAQAYTLLSPRPWLPVGRHPRGTHAPTAPSSNDGRLGGLVRRAIWPFSLALLLMLSFIPVQLTVLAPAELVAIDPALVRAPMDGVIDRILVKPNQAVKTGQALFEFDRISVDSRLKIAASTLATSQAEYRNRAQRALFDPESKAQLAIIQGQIDEKRAELDYLKSLSGRAVVLAPQDGVVLFGDTTEWIGRPVVTGERVMMVARPESAQIEAWLSPGDAIPIALGSEVLMYLNTDPLLPLKAQLRYIAHEAIMRPEGHYAYRVRAELLPGPGVRVGLKGSARLTGERVSLAYWVLRRPMAQARAWLGL